MPALFRIGPRVFAPSWGMTIAAGVAIGLFIALGRWQWTRGEARQIQNDAFDSGAAHTILLRGERALREVPRYQRVSLTGRYDVAHQFLLDNRIHDGRAGYEVLTPLERANGEVLLVNRGWVPFTGFRDLLPDVSFAAADASVAAGRIDELPTAGLQEGRQPPLAGTAWPKVTSFPTIDELSAALGRELQPQVLLLDADLPNGYLRNWQSPGLAPARHWSYAVQWWSFGVLALVLWVVLSFRKIET